MTNNELEKLADLIVTKIMKRQAEYDKKFVELVMNVEQLEDHEIGFMSKYLKTNEELVALHLDRLESMLQIYLNSEQYELAAKVQKEIEKIKNCLE